MSSERKNREGTGPFTNLEELDVDYTERWEFLKSLSHRFIRDIAFVIASPNLLLDSDELPIVNNRLLGGDKRKWELSKKWLKTVDACSVIKWFDARKSRTRLGDHFAAAVEYVLRFSPVVQVKRLLVSQQVLHRINLCNKNTLENNTGQSPCNSQPPKQSGSLIVPTDTANVVFEPKAKEAADVTSSTQKVCTTSELNTCFTGKQREKQKSSDKAITQTIGEFDFLFQIPYHGHEDLKFQTKSRDFKQNSDTDNSKGTSEDSKLKSAPTCIEEEVHHWEVSVKFLLYAGPWEVFGIETPDYAAWKFNKNNESPVRTNISESERLQRPDSHFQGTFCTTSDSRGGYDSVCGSDKFLGCYLGPHVGETLFDRKSRICNQLQLSKNSIAASFLQRTYLVADTSQQTNDNEDFHLPHPRIREQEIKEARHGVKIVPCAILKGYLFYEFELWQYVLTNRGHNACKHHQFCGLGLLRTEQASGRCPSCTYKPTVDGRHWMGWWAHIDDFGKLASLPDFENSRWYIVPKREWLSPVIVNGSPANGTSEVLVMEQLLAVATKVAEEAAASKIARKRRFMVAEVRWNGDFVGATKCKTGIQDGNSSLQIQGAWVEASRGFIVEETWPDIKTYKPHGYVPGWSPCMQKQA